MQIQAGVYWDQAATVASAGDRLVVSGISGNGTVGAAGGWQLGGGHSCLAPSYGLGVDNVLQYRVALAPCDDHSSAAIVDANEVENADLFWALRGGGGPTFGIVTELFYKTHPQVATLVQIYSALLIDDAETYVDLLEVLLNAVPNLTDDHWGGYDTAINTTTNGTSVYNLNVAYFRPGVTNSSDSDSIQTQNQTIQDLIGKLSEVASKSPGANITATNFFSPDWTTVYKALTDPQAVATLGGGSDAVNASVQRRHLDHAEEAHRRHTVVKRLVSERQDQSTPPDDSQGGGVDTTPSADGVQTSRLIPRELYSGDKARRYATWLAKQSVCPCK